MRENRTSRPRAAWLDDGIVIAGSWEPLRGHIRNRADHDGTIRRRFEREHSEETVARLREAGVTLYLTNLYKGFGVAAEREEMERTKAFAALCRKHDMRVCVYVQSVSTIYYETFFKEVPEARNWVSRDQDGRIPTYADSSYRYVPCPNCEQYLSYIEDNVLTYAANEVRTDMVHFDNFRWWGEPEACRCERCAQHFREFLAQTWPEQAMRFSHFGIDDFSLVEPPKFNPLRPPWEIGIIPDPISQAWVDFKCERLADLYKRFADFLRGLNPEIAVECNIDIWSGSNSAINRGAWARSVYPHGELFWTEEPPTDRGMSESGALVSKIRQFKTGAATRNIVLSYAFSPPAQAESMAFSSNCLGMIGWLNDIVADESEEGEPYVEFFHRNNDIFKNTESDAEVGVLHSYHSLCYGCNEPHLELILAEQTLIQGHIPYDIVFDSELSQLERYRVLVLPGVEFLSDEVFSAVRDYVDQGGGLVMTGT